MQAHFNSDFSDSVICGGELKRCWGAGPNGCGKSTLLRLVMGREKPIKGAVELGEYAIEPNYFEQNQVRSPCRVAAMSSDMATLRMLVSLTCGTWHKRRWVPCQECL